ncbi:MAG TPA: hypothetical protein VHN14_08945 [Kofleriaceae bacterium]|nr:hypothetical protein [Kofleriaceae bacterium]
MAFAVIAAACHDPVAHVRLTPLGGACGRPVGANLVKVTAYAASGEHSQSVALDESLAIADFPAETLQIGVEVLVGGGATGAAGKSAPLVFDALADGATIPVFMAPPDGFCEVGAMTEPRAQPLVARAGAGVLVVGGIGPAGPLSTAEYYDPATATFTRVDVPQVLTDDTQGFVGAALATLPDGRVALIGGPHNAFVVFDPQLRAFATDPALIDPRAFHAALAVGGGDVLVAGGCSAIATRQCSGVPRRQMLRYHVAKTSVPDPVAILPMTSSLRIAAQLFDLGIQLDGRHPYLLAGGTGDPGLANRFTLTPDEIATTLPGGHTQAVALDGGAVLTVFGDDAAAAGDGTASVYPPDAGAATRVAKTSDDRFVRLVTLEDGRVAGFGGDPTCCVRFYDPTRDTWTSVQPGSPGQPGSLIAPSLARLADGTVLVLGGAVSAQAWLFRPSLVGPASGSVTAVPASDNGHGVLTAPDPATVTRPANPPAWLLTAPGDALTARALVGGPRMAAGSVRAIVHVQAGGLALIAQQTSPGQAIVAELVPGQPPRLVRLDADGEHLVCSRSPALAAFDPAIPVTLRLAISDHDARLSLDDSEILSCQLVATDRGAWGVAALGAGAALAVDSVTVAR